MRSFILKGTICHSVSPTELAVYEHSYAVCVDGVSMGVFGEIPAEFSHLPVLDYGESLIVPGMVDLHIHAPQYTFRGTGMDLELMDWLQQQAFPEEARFESREYAENAYQIFAEQLKNSATTRAVVFGTRHGDSTEILMEKLAKIRRERQLPVQSHLSENPGEIAFVRQLFPEEASYGHCYDRFDLLGQDTIMAHCVYSSPEEVRLLKQTGTFIAHCPASNTNLASGIAPIRRYLDSDLRVGLGSDVAGGHTESMFRAITDTVQMSKMYWRLVDEDCKPLRFAEAFYLATLGGGAFFGKVGSFAPGYEFDALVLEEGAMPHWSDMNPKQRLEQYAYLEKGNSSLQAKFVCGKQIL